MIESYSFGRMVIDGKTFSSDIMIYPDGHVRDSWWRKQGHRLSVDDISDLVDCGPQVIIAGTGAYGIMKPDPDLARLLSANGIELIAVPTETAVETYNKLCNEKKAGACFHLTC
jgi:hypothetical protein